VQVVRRTGNRCAGTWHDARQPLRPAEAVTGFVVQPMRWVVERTHAWIERNRRLATHQDRCDRARVAWVWLTQSRLLATRLAN